MSERLFVWDKAKWEQAVNKNYHIDKLPEVFEVQNGIVLPCKDKSGGVCDSEFNFKAGLIREFNNPPGWGGIGSSYTIDKSSLKFIDETVVFGGVLLPAFGHMMLDCLTRLWWHVENYESKLRYVFVLNRWGWKDWIWDFFDLLGIDRERILIVKEPTQFGKIIVPEEAAHSWYRYTDKWECVYNLMAKNALVRCANETLPKKIYLSKSKYNSRGTPSFNEGYFEEWYSQHGYEVIYPEQLPIYRQVALVANAEAIATVLGTTSHFNLFAKPGTRVDFITRADNQVLLPQCIINQMKQADFYFIDGTLNWLPCDRSHGPYFLAITEYWKDFVKQMWGEDIGDEKMSTELYLQYAEEWARFFCDNPQSFNDVNFQDLDGYDILERMARVLLGRKLDKSKYNVVSKSQLRKERDDAIKQLSEARAEVERRLLELKGHTDKEFTWFKGVADKLQTEMQAARETYSKNEERLNLALKKSEAEVREERQSRLKSERENAKLAAEYNVVRNSMSYKLGRFITFIPRKIRNIFKKGKVKK